MYLSIDQAPANQQPLIQLLLKSGFDYIPEHFLTKDSSQFLYRLTAASKKADVKLEYVHDHKEYCPIMDHTYEYRYGYCFVLNINGRCVMSYRRLPQVRRNAFDNSKNHSFASNSEVTRFLSPLYKTKDEGKFLFMIFQNVSDDHIHESNREIFQYLVALHSFNQEMKKKDKVLFAYKNMSIHSNRDPWLYTIDKKPKTKKLRVIAVRKQLLLLMGSEEVHVVNPEWFTDEGVEFKNIKEIKVYTHSKNITNENIPDLLQP